jgi:hypothetical protein
MPKLAAVIQQDHFKHMAAGKDWQVSVSGQR